MAPSKSNVFSHADSEGFEQVVFCHDRETGLRSIISIHSTLLGPSLGGCRFYPYETEEDALTDSLNLARAMTYKAALAELPLGGGKAVIMGNPATDKTPSLWKAYAHFVDRIGGQYITTVDSGTSTADMDLVRQHTKFVVGMSPSAGGSGDPSPTTALGVAEGIRATAKFVFGSDSLQGKKIAIQGIGHVGFVLAKRLKGFGAQILVSDKSKEALAKASKELGAEVIDSPSLFSTPCDIFAPCALGGVINNETVSKLKCAIVAGAANNPLSSPEIAEGLHKRGISYAPDFAINAGGLIHVASELDGFNAKRVEEKTMKIYDTILTILKRAQSEKVSPSHLAMTLASERLQK
jgi:leucine dehydrogenase